MEQIIRGLLALGLIIAINFIETIESKLYNRNYNIKRVVISCIIVVVIMGFLPILIESVY